MEETADLFTNSKTIRDRMSNEYFPSRNPLENQQLGDRDEPLFNFIGLDLKRLFSYLDYLEPELSPEDDYEVRHSITGRYLRLRKTGLVLSNQDEIEKSILE